jgi:hypothetical protein
MISISEGGKSLERFFAISNALFGEILTLLREAQYSLNVPSFGGKVWTCWVQDATTRKEKRNASEPALNLMGKNSLL